MTHPDYPDGFPPAIDDSLYGEHACGVSVTEHEHGYELDYAGGHNLTVAGDRPDTVLLYLALAGSLEHEQRLRDDYPERVAELDLARPASRLAR